MAAGLLETGAAESRFFETGAAEGRFMMQRNLNTTEFEAQLTTKLQQHMTKHKCTTKPIVKIVMTQAPATGCNEQQRRRVKPHKPSGRQVF